MAADIRAKVIEVLTQVCGTAEVAEEPDADLFEADLLDSLGFTELLVALEDTFGLVIPPTEVDRAELASVNQIVAFVQDRQG